MDKSGPTEPHETSLAVWDNPSPVVIGERYGLKVAARCTAGCVLAGKPIEIRDEAGERVAGAVLGDTPLPGTTALYWTDIGVVAPVEPGVFSWSLHFPAADRPLPHRASSCSFTFVVVPPPEHFVAVKVVERDTEAPIHDAHVRLGVYRASTDATGLARFAVAGAEHRLFVSKPGYEVPERTIDVTKKGHVQVEAAVLPVDDPDAYWQG